jgi:hypothetical protein
MFHKRRRYADGDEIARDGEIVTTRLMLADSDPLHRPGPFTPRQQQRDSIDTDDHCSLEQRRGISLADAQALRDEAFANLCTRSENAWRRKFGDAADPDNNNNNDPDEDEPPERGDESALAEAQRRRDQAFAELEQRSQNAWRMSPAEATATELQGERWRGGK